MTPTVVRESVLEWASTVGEGRIDAFRDAYSWLADTTDRTEATRALVALERLCHVDIDWDRRRFCTTPTAVAAIDGAAANVLLVGARTRHTLGVLDVLHREGRAVVTRIAQRGPGPDAIYIEVASDDDLRAVASRVGAVVASDARVSYKDLLASLDQMLNKSAAQFTASGLQARQLDPITMAFQPVEVRGGHWYPGCFEQQSRGVQRFLFVDDDGTLHNTDRQVAIHAEIRRRRLRGERVQAAGVPIAWDAATERLVCSMRARLPLMHERAAIICSGLLPRVRDVELHGEPLPVFVYEGVAATTYNRIAATLGYPHVAASVPIEEQT